VTVRVTEASDAIGRNPFRVLTVTACRVGRIARLTNPGCPTAKRIFALRLTVRPQLESQRHRAPLSRDQHIPEVSIDSCSPRDVGPGPKSPRGFVRRFRGVAAAWSSTRELRHSSTIAGHRNQKGPVAARRRLPPGCPGSGFVILKMSRRRRPRVHHHTGARGLPPGRIPTRCK